MKKILLILTALSMSSSFAALDMKTGLWKVEVKVNNGGKEVNLQSEMQKALAKMPPERKKQMMEMMAKMNTGAGMSENGDLQVCYNEKMLGNEASMLQQNKDKKCDTKIKEKSSKKFVAEFNCTDGTKGTATWNVTSQTSYSGNVKAEKAGKITEINHQGQFVSKDCGKIKPRL